jgi:hypothetical protein
VKPLENRFLLSSASSYLAHERVVPPPKPVGIAIQSGAVLDVTVSQPTSNIVHVRDDGTGYVRVDWNGGLVQSFTGVETVAIRAQRARRDQITFNLAKPAPVLPEVESGQHGPAAAAAGESSVQAHSDFSTIQHGGIAIQTGPLLTVTVQKSSRDTVQIADQDAGIVHVSWNGGPGHTFAGIDVIVVDTQKARNIRVTFTEPIA